MREIGDCGATRNTTVKHKDSVSPPLASLVVWIVISLLTIACSSDRANVSASQADTTAWPQQFGFGREASAELIHAWDIDVRPDGKGLPQGAGTVGEGRQLYNTRCGRCHGASGWGGPYMALVTDTAHNKAADERADKTIGNYWPYASTLYDYIHRAMPFDSSGSLSPNEVYSLTAFLLYANRIIDSTTVLNAQSLPQVAMPAQSLFIPDDRQGGPEIR